MITPTVTAIRDGLAQKFVWELTSADPDGAPIGIAYIEYADRTITAVGTWGGATFQWQGGDGATWLPLTDPQGNAISKTADAIEVVTEVPEQSRPILSTPGAGATVTVTCIARRGFKRT